MRRFAGCLEMLAIAPLSLRFASRLPAGRPHENPSCLLAAPIAERPARTVTVTRRECAAAAVEIFECLAVFYSRKRQRSRLAACGRRCMCKAGSARNMRARPRLHAAVLEDEN